MQLTRAAACPTSREGSRDLRSQQLVDAEVPSDEVLRQGQRANREADRCQHLARQAPGAPTLQEEQVRQAAGQQCDTRVRLDRRAVLEDAREARETEKPAGDDRQADRRDQHARRPRQCDRA